MDKTTQMPLAVCLMGPTASGKTALAMAMADKLPFEIISVDATQVYVGLDVGSAKPDAEMLGKYPHRLIDIRDPCVPYSVAEFRKDAFLAVREIIARGNIPLLVGGSMLYFKALLGGLASLPSANKEVRSRILSVAKECGWVTIHNMLSKIDPETSRRLHPNDAQRLQRALEVYVLSGRPLSHFHKQQENDSHSICRFVNIVIAPGDRKLLHERIESRCRMMFSNGLIDEVRKLRSRKDLNLELPSMRSVGYRQVWQHLDGSIDGGDDLIDRCIVSTRQLAKRQLTWLRSWPDARWFDSLSTTLSDDVLRVVNSRLEQLTYCKKTSAGYA